MCGTLQIPIRSLKLLLSLSVFACDWLFELRKIAGGSSTSGTCVFINYHSISDATQVQFAMQMAVLQRLARPVSALHPQMLQDGTHYVGVTFDDAFRSFSKYALPVLESLNIPALLFVPTGFLGRKSAWLDYGGDNPIGEEVLSAQELAGLTKSKRVQLGSHCVSHPNLKELTSDQVRAELHDSKMFLEDMVSGRIDSISFPYGSFGQRELQLAREEGYLFCFSVLPQTLVSEISPGLIGRVSVQPSDWPLEFRLKVLGAYHWVSWASAWKGRVLRRSAVRRNREESVRG